MNDQLIADPSNSDQAGHWNGNDGALWTVEAQRFDNTFANIQQPFLSAAAVRSVHRVLDIGGGTGQTTRECARLASQGSVLGIDLSSSMLARARNAAEAEGLTNVEFRNADAQIHEFEPD